MLALLTLLHFCVDGICGAVLHAYEIQESEFRSILFFFALYNLIAFGGQWFAGWILDKKKHWLPVAFLLALSTLGMGICGLLGTAMQTICLGLGNCVFHVAAGSYVLRRYQTFSELGIFVSSGAIGLALGLNGFVTALPFWLVAAAATAAILPGMLSCCSGNAHPAAFPLPTVARASSLVALVPLACAVPLLGCIILRGFSGGGRPEDYVPLLPCVFALGKALGGIICDRIGYSRTVLLIFLLSFTALQFRGMASTLLLILASNMTMPLTLRLLHWCAPAWPGLIFGLAAGCLLPGFFFREMFSLPPQAMVVIQFLALFFVGYVFKYLGISVMRTSAGIAGE